MATAYDAQSLQERARKLAPTLRARAVATSQARQIPDETIQDLWEAGLWHLLKPKKFGGPEVRFSTVFETAFELSRGDGSAGWVWAVMSVHDPLVACYPEEFQHEYWGNGLKTLSASSFSPGGKATPAKGGWSLSGKWSFCSGVDHADWMLLAAIFGMLPTNPPMPDIRYAMIPNGTWTVIDDWHVLGLRGTGSKSVACDNVIVPEHRLLPLAAMVQYDKSPGAKAHDSPLYRAPMFAHIPFCISSPAAGIAQGAFDAFVEEMKVREGSFDHAALAKKPNLQMRVAEAGAMIDCAKLLYQRSLRETIDKTMAGEELTLPFRARSRRDQGYQVSLAKRAAELLMTGQGGRGIFEDNHVQRSFRDLQALSGHIVAGWDMPALLYGSVTLGGPPTDFFW
jgi:alkylation response protein AidB-like acyl-CoA dehydrogenase